MIRKSKYQIIGPNTCKVRIPTAENLRMRSLEENKIIEIKDEIIVRQENQMSKVYSVLLINIAH
jgi:hypothetical protein